MSHSEDERTERRIRRGGTRDDEEDRDRDFRTAESSTEADGLDTSASRTTSTTSTIHVDDRSTRSPTPVTELRPTLPRRDPVVTPVTTPTTAPLTSLASGTADPMAMMMVMFQQMESQRQDREAAIARDAIAREEYRRGREEELLRIQQSREDAREERIRADALARESRERQDKKAESEARCSQEAQRHVTRYAQMAKGAELDSFLTGFESHMGNCGVPESRWIRHLAPTFNEKVIEAYGLISTEDKQDYQIVKRTLLREFNVTQESYKRQLNLLRKKDDDSWLSVESQVMRLQDKWTSECKTIKEVNNLVVKEHVLKMMPVWLAGRIRDLKPATSRDAAEMADSHLSNKRAAEEGSGNGTANRRPWVDRSKESSTPSPMTRRDGYRNESTTTAASKDRSSQKSKDGLPNWNKEGQPKCYRCLKYGHKIGDCPEKVIKVNLVQRIPETVTCARIDGKHIPEVLLDTGAGTTIVRSDCLEDPDWTGERVLLKGFRATPTYLPAANVTIEVLGIEPE